jgi:hypothetical protein
MAAVALLAAVVEERPTVAAVERLTAVVAERPTAVAAVAAALAAIGKL